MCKKYPTGPMVRRILRHLDAATAQQRDEGTRWYRDARAFCSRQAIGTDYGFVQVAYVVAALSPQNTWDNNMHATKLAIAAHATGTWDGESLPGYAGYGANVRKAFRILQGDLTALRGPKVEAFAAAIVGDMSRVTVDIWATRAARCEADNITLAYCDGELPGIVEHRAIAESYRRAAALRGITPSECQAIVWTVVRESARWIRPQFLTAGERAAMYRRQARARAARGLGQPYDWNGHTPAREAAYA